MKLYFVFIFIVSSIIAIHAQNMYTSQTKYAQDLPFREVLASFETPDGAVWMVLPSKICRNNGHEVACFHINKQGVEAAFMAEDRYIVVHTLSRNNASYFDTQTLQESDFPWKEGYSLIYHHLYSEQLEITDYDKIYKFDFAHKALKYIKENTIYCQDLHNIKYRLSNGSALPPYKLDYYSMA